MIVSIPYSKRKTAKLRKWEANDPRDVEALKHGSRSGLRIHASEVTGDTLSRAALEETSESSDSIDDTVYSANILPIKGSFLEKIILYSNEDEEKLALKDFILNG
ncbi:hypothetical protein NPIL_402981 [Nephila pilipes]|uniref:Uncharacterized protein n=1 Tax=Nephila pilipes TaxID=299642 RepID=A0A8X6QRB7_NEPPI|nr:hypothetical protein NPIL_402981 [Nephila pilipes]